MGQQQLAIQVYMLDFWQLELNVRLNMPPGPICELEFDAHGSICVSTAFDNQFTTISMWAKNKSY